MRLVVFICSLFLSCYSFSESSEPVVPSNIDALSNLLTKIKQQGDLNAATHAEREALFKKEKAQIESELALATKKLKQTKSITRQLTNDFESNEEQLGKLETELKQSLGNLGEMFGVVRQVAQDVESIQNNSLLKVEIGQSSQVLTKLAESKALPSITELEELWFEMQRHMTKQGDIKKLNTQYIDTDGKKVDGEIAHIGPFVAFNDSGYLNFDAETGYFLQLGKQPSQSASAIDFYEETNADFESIYIDPTRGNLLSISSQSPSIFERINQGGAIGYVIISMAIIGITFGIFLLMQRLLIAKKVNEQLKYLDTPSTDNPLGRILAVYNGEKEVSDLETLEMKLDEAVLKELPEIEKGLPLIKLLAAVAPLLGLLGTVTGMIATFQSITLFGTGDPKLMASGISQALITTVLGLVAAIPLLFMHNLINSRSKVLIQILAQQSAGIIAEQAQKRH